jgi:2-keto-4-pentenoate hydratase
VKPVGKGKPLSSAALVTKLARELYAAERAATSVPPLSERHPGLTATDAYAIQEGYADLRRARGARLVGRKIGATSQAIQDLFGIDTPDYGHIFEDMCIEDGGAVRREALIQPMVEPELAFVLDRELRGPGVTRTDVLAAIQSVVPCLEVIDSRIDDWRIAFVDTVADNGSSARCVFGDEREADSLDLAAVEGELYRNGELVARATGDAVLGHPADAVAWLANALGTYSRSLREGDYVLSGSFTTAVPAQAGDSFEASFSGFGPVSCHFV